MLSRFYLLPEGHGQTERQTDRQADAQTDRQTELLYQYRASVCSVLTRDKNRTAMNAIF